MTCGTRVASGIDLSLEGGGIMAVLGPNGAGKSSFIKGLCGLRPAADAFCWMMPIFFASHRRNLPV